MYTNYRRHLEFELQARIEESKRLAVHSQKAEAKWVKAVDEVQWRTEQLKQLQTYEAQIREEFREIHARHSSVRQIVGEIQEELHSSCEEEEEWRH